VGPVRRHAVRVQQFRRRARVPVDDDMRIAIHARPGNRWLLAGVVRLPDHVRRSQGVSLHDGRRFSATRVPHIRRRVLFDGRIRALCPARDVGQELPRNRGLLHAVE